jgi:hypothetical protein
MDLLDKTKNIAPLRSAIGMMEQWNDGIMGSDLRLVDPAARRECWNGALENQNEHNCIYFLVILAHFLERKQKMDV